MLYVVSNTYIYFFPSFIPSLLSFFHSILLSFLPSFLPSFQITFDDFQQAILSDGGGAGGLGDGGDEDAALELVGSGAGGGNSDLALANIKVTPRRLDGLEGLPDGMEEDESVNTLTIDMLSHIKVKQKEPGVYTNMWDSAGTMSRTKAGIWAPDMDSGALKRNAVRVCLGTWETQYI